MMTYAEFDHIERMSVRDALRDFLVQYRHDVVKSAKISFRPMARQYGIVFRSEIPILRPDWNPLKVKSVTLNTVIRISPHTIADCALFYDTRTKQINDRINHLCREPIKLGEFLEKYQQICDGFAGAGGDANILRVDGGLCVEFYIPITVHVRGDGFTFVAVVNHDPQITSVVLTDASLGIENDYAEDDGSGPCKKRKRQHDVSIESVDDD